MKKAVFLIFTSLVLTQGIFAQADKQKIAGIEKTRMEIRKNITTLRKIEKSKDIHGYRDIYLKGKELQLTIVDYKDQDTDKYVEWYFSGGKLIYSEELWTNIKTSKIVNDQKYYFENDQMIAWIKKDDKMVDPKSKEFKILSQQLVIYSGSLKGEAQ